MRAVLMALIVAGLCGCRAASRVHGEAAARAPAVQGERGEAGARWEVIGRSVEGRDIRAAELGAAGAPPARRVYVIGGIHGNEPEGLAAVEPLCGVLAREASAWGARVRVVADMNPDGTEGGTRGNARGRDLNRNWPAANFRRGGSRGGEPLSEPETAAVHADVMSFAPDLVIVFHSIASGPFVNFDGPAGELAAAFVEAARAEDRRWRVQASMGYATPGSLGTYLGVERGVAVLTVEFRRGQDAGSVWEAVRAGVEAAVRGMGE